MILFMKFKIALTVAFFVGFFLARALHIFKPAPAAPASHVQVQTCVWPHTCVKVSQVQTCVWPHVCNAKS